MQKKTKKPAQVPRRPGPKELYVVLGTDGVVLGAYPTEDDALSDCWGPLYRDARIKRYALDPAYGGKDLRDYNNENTRLSRGDG